MHNSFKSEISELQSNLTKFKQVKLTGIFTWRISHHQIKKICSHGLSFAFIFQEESQFHRSPMSDELKRKLDEIEHENRHLKSQLTDVETNLAVTKSEVVNLKHDLDEKTEELDRQV